MSASIKDVAKLAGVSPSTVSRIVNGGVSAAASLKTQEKIWEAVRKVGYVPNSYAQTLKSGAEQSVRNDKRKISCIYARTCGPEIDPFFTVLMQAAEVKAFSMGYILQFYYSAIDIQAGRFPYPERGSAEEISSALVLGRTDSSTMALLKGFYRHIICAGLNEMDFEVDQVISSGYEAAVKCVEYLHGLGHTRIGYVGETENEQRYLGYCKAMGELGFSDEGLESLVADMPFTPSGGYDAVKLLMERGADFTALLCANDISAAGVYRGLREYRLRVPKDVSVIGINDMETVRYLDPMLTTVHIPLDEMGEMAAKLLIDRIEGGHKLPLKMYLPNRIVCRESCGECRNV